MTDISDPPSLLPVLYAAQVQNYVLVACMVAAIYDNLHTLPLEVQYIWLSRTTIATVLYYVTRYGIYIEQIALFYGLFASPEGCSYSTWISGYLFDASVWAGEALLGLRVLALSGNDRRLKYALSTVFFAFLITSLVMLGTFFNSMKFVPSPAPKIMSCCIIQANTDIIKTIICVVVWDILMFILLLRSACYTYISGGTSLFVRTLYRDGLIYYLSTLILHVGNLISFFVAPPDVSSVLTRPTRFLQGAFVCRVLLYTRQQEERTNAEMIGSICEEVVVIRDV